MKWFLSIVVLNLMHEYAYGEEITMFVNVNDTVDIKVKEKPPGHYLHICKAQLYSDAKVLIASYTLLEIKQWQLNDKDPTVMKYFEFLDYNVSCSFTISPFPKEFYGHWIVNTTTYGIIVVNGYKKDVYPYEYQEFHLSIPPKENISYSIDDHFEFKNDTEKNITHNISCFNGNPISLRPNKVSGQIVNCLAIHYDDFVKLENATEVNPYDPNKRVYEIYPNTFDEFIYTGNNKSCQFKIKRMTDQFFYSGKHALIHPMHQRWEIRTIYELSEKKLHQIDTFMVYMKNRKRSQMRFIRPPDQGMTQGYMRIERLDNVKNSGVVHFVCQFNRGDGQTEIINSPTYDPRVLREDHFYRRINYENDYGYFFNAKYSGDYKCYTIKKGGIHEKYEFKQNVASLQCQKELFDGPFKVGAPRSCYDILAIEGSMFPFWLTNLVPKNISLEELELVIEMPNGTLIGFDYTQKSGAYSFGHNDTLERKGLYKNLSLIDNGTWKLYYYNISSNDTVYPEFTSIYSITTWDSTHVKVTVDTTERNSIISIYNIKENPQRCIFLSANGTVIAESKPKVLRVKRNETCLCQNHEIDNDLNECELEITQPLKNDYNIKETLIDYGNFTINRTIILQNNFQRIKKYNAISDMQGKKNLFVKHGDDFLVNCSYNRPLLFCRIQDAAQQVTHITEKSTLEAGNCSMLVTDANILDHNGTWLCQLAFNESNIGSTIVEYFFSVEVRNFYVRSYIEYINETSQQKNETTIKQVVLHCEISNYLKGYENSLIEDNKMEYCSWNHPNGSIISNNITTTSFSCELRINKLYERDIGSWTCRPHLKLLTNLNLHDTIRLVKRPTMLIVQNYTVTPELKRMITTYDDHHNIVSTAGSGLDCHISPAVEANLISCKWIKINGNHNFTAGDIDDSHYFSRKNNSLCELRLTRWVESGDDSDYGKWRCCVSIVDSDEPTICQDIELPNEVVRPPKQEIGIYIFISIAIICVLAVICYCFYFIMKKLKEKRKKKQRQSRRSRSSRRQRRARSASHQSRVRSSNQENRARSSSHPRQPTSSLQSRQQDAQTSRIISARIRAKPNIYV